MHPGHRLHLRPSHGLEMVEMMMEMMKVQTGSPVPAGLP